MARLSRETSSGWAPSAPANDEPRATWATPSSPDPAPRIRWPASAGRDMADHVRWAQPQPTDARHTAAWIRAQAAAAPALRLPWVIAARVDQERLLNAPTSAITPACAVQFIPWVLSARADRALRQPGATSPVVPMLFAAGILWGLSATADALEWVPWGMGRLLDSSTGIIVEPPDPEEPDAPVIIPVLRAYIVINSASLTRVSNNLALPVSSLTLSIDDSSAHWTWSATLPLYSLDDLDPDSAGELVELNAIVNGVSFRLLVQSRRERESFASGGLAIGGRGIAAELSAPNYPVVSHNNVGGALTAQQIALEALTSNGVSLGWSLDWQAADWLVPAGAWVHNGTPLDAVVRIAAAAGAYVQASPAARTLRVLPRYPVAPWDWGTTSPAVVLPASAVLERGTDHVSQPGYNVVYVSGQAGGVLARVKRQGSAGDVPAEMVVDQLVTHADAARGRGLEILGNTGLKQITTLETGILPASGVIHVGTLMDWTRGSVARRGIVRGLAISAIVSAKDPIKVRQSIEVETRG